MSRREHDDHPAHGAHSGHDSGHDDHGRHDGPDDHASHGGSHAARSKITLEADSAWRMAEAAATFLAMLTPEQRERATYPADHDERQNWHYVPKARNGLPFTELDGAQQKYAHALLSSGLSQRGYAKAVSIMGLESILAQLEGPQRRHARNPDLYHVTIFGEPSDTKPWGWRVEGHHVSVNVLVVEGSRIAPTPNFFGSNPARVPEGAPAAGLRVLAAEEDLARSLVTSLEDSLRRRAVIAPEAPSDILSRAERRVKRDTPAGVRAGELASEQRLTLMDLIGEYVGRMPRDVADTRLDRIEKEGSGHIHFAWAGDLDPGQPHYYRLQGPTFLVEYDNTQNGANHIHSVWRDFEGDWGHDLLADHYQASH